MTYVNLIDKFQVNFTCYIFMWFVQNLHLGLKGQR